MKHIEVDGCFIKKKKLNILYIKIDEKLVDVFTTRDIHKGGVLLENIINCSVESTIVILYFFFLYIHIV
jgi:hypothetical protein